MADGGQRRVVPRRHDVTPRVAAVRAVQSRATRNVDTQSVDEFVPTVQVLKRAPVSTARRASSSDGSASPTNEARVSPFTRPPRADNGAASRDVDSAAPSTYTNQYVDHTRYSLPLINPDFTWNVDTAKVLSSRSTAGGFLVVGCVGAQNTGKSTLMSMLARNRPDDMFRDYVFRPCAKEAIELGRHQTNGVHMFIDDDGHVFLDTQPLCSQSLVDDAVRVDRRFAHDYVSMENAIELESLQMLTFMLSVCHVLLVTDDVFMSADTARLLHTALYARPLVRVKLNAKTGDSTAVPAAGTTASSRHAPVVAFVQQRCRRRNDYDAATVRRRACLLRSMLAQGDQVCVRSGISLLSWTEAREDCEYRLRRVFSDGAVSASGVPRQRHTLQQRLAPMFHDIVEQIDTQSGESVTSTTANNKQAETRATTRRINYFPIGELKLRTRDDPPPNRTGTAQVGADRVTVSADDVVRIGRLLRDYGCTYGSALSPELLDQVSQVSVVELGKTSSAQSLKPDGGATADKIGGEITREQLVLLDLLRQQVRDNQQYRDSSDLTSMLANLMIDQRSVPTAAATMQSTSDAFYTLSPSTSVVAGDANTIPTYAEAVIRLRQMIQTQTASRCLRKASHNACACR